MNGLCPDTNEGLIGQLFGQNLQSFPESTCQIEYMDILGGDMNDGRLPGQRTRWRHSQILIWKFISQSCKGHPSSARNGVKIRRAAVSLRGIGDWALMTRFHDDASSRIFFFLFFVILLKTCHYWLLLVHWLLLAQEI